RVVELHRRGRMDDDVAPPQLGAARVGQTEPVCAEVDLQDRKLLRGEARESLFAQLILQALERRARKHLALEPFRGRTPRARADGEVDAAHLRDRAEGLLNDRLAEKAGRSVDQQGVAVPGCVYVEA